MKKFIGRCILSPEFQSSILAAPVRSFVRWSHRWLKFSPNFRLDMQAIERPHYAYCMLRAADLAKALGISRISAIEFGVAGGNGVRFMADFASEVERVTGVAVDVYGFDTGGGMPPPEEARDLPYWFAAQQYAMDESKLRASVPTAKLMIGPVNDTIDSFLEQHDPAPIGCMFFDMDYYSSTRDSFRLFADVAKHHANFLPRIFTYFDDIIGTDLEMYGPFNGQLAAIEDFNKSQEDIKIHLNQNLVFRPHIRYGSQIYYIHLFRHPQYDTYLNSSRQDMLEDTLKLKESKA